MIVTGNGLYKSGSTYVYSALRIALSPGGPPKGIQVGQKNKLNPKFSRSNLDLSEHIDVPVVFKTHTYDLLVLEDLRHRDSVVMIFTDRDTQAILKSHYHHFANEKIKLPFSIYAISVGLIKALEVELYRSAFQDPTFRKDSKADLITIPHSKLFGKTEEVASELLSNPRFRKFREEILQSFDTAFVQKGADVASITGMQNRSWFTNRKELQLSSTQFFLLRAVNGVAKNVVKVGLLNKGLRFLSSSLRQQRRSYFRP